MFKFRHEWPERLVVDLNHNGPEEPLLMEHAKKLEIPIVKSTAKMMERGRTPITRNDLVAGSVKFVIQAMRQLGIEVPPDESYPDNLSQFLGRKVEKRRSFAEVQAEVEHRGISVFVKPSDTVKRFTGFVLSPSGSPQAYGVSKSRPVWTSEIIKTVSEWRAYVVYGRVVCMAHYDGDKTIQPDEQVVHEIIRTFEWADAPPSGYAIDFCVDDQARTLLLEYNGGFSIGAYKPVSAKQYWNMTANYWWSLLQSQKASLPA